MTAGAAAQQDFWTDLVYPDPPNGVLRTYRVGLGERGDAVAINNRGNTCGMMSFSTGMPIVWSGFVHTQGGR